MIQLHDDEQIYLPRFKPEIVYASNEERNLGKRQMTEFRKGNKKRQEHANIGKISW